MQVSVNKRPFSFVENCVSAYIRMLRVVHFVLECCSDHVTNSWRHVTTVVFKQCSTKLQFSSYINMDC
jgi:hypothetical protein